MKPVVSIVGRPNVGKSSIFNRLIRRRSALVHDMPGVTRDRKTADWTLDDVTVELIDTGGLAVDDHDVIVSGVAAQVRSAIAGSDVILFVVDGRAGPLPQDAEIARLLRGTGKPIVLLVNKMDVAALDDSEAPAFFELGLGTPLPISAEHGRGFDDLREAVVAGLGNPPADAPPAEPAGEHPVRIAIVGRPNVGKSTLVNRLLGEDRMLVSDIPGTTRDAVDSLLTRDGRRYLIIDTAGIRRRRSIDTDVEKLSVSQAFDAIGRCDVVLMLLDATARVTEQDARVAGFAHEKGRGIIVLANKWDAAIKAKAWRDKAHYEAELRYDLKYLGYAPVYTTSGKTGDGTDRILPAVDAVFADYCKRVPTAELNRVLAAVQEENQPPMHKGRRVKFYYAAQTDTRPPRFTVITNSPEGVHFSYRRYVINGFRANFGFEGVPIEITYKPRAGRHKKKD